ncbi:hypothetical protein BDY19DRAFT_926949 [Irpex rosettiformis]|uniref:Uncharacterized protein n=1 Tax=Irpex rosettiformis TaxID=378272 RepID=A0ACB8UF39_9APHY|nr:hypothetical protein BDY19DRAFT_926949 [Irpex rosettiformis]
MSSSSLMDEVNDHPLSGKDSTNSVPFPTPETEKPTLGLPDSETSSSIATSSDKLSALPGFQPSPAIGRTYGGPRTTSRRSFDPSSPLPVIQSSPALNTLQRVPTPASHYSASESSVHGRDTPKQRVSFDSERGTLPAALRNLRQAIANRSISQQQDSGPGSPSVRSRESSRPRHQSNSSPNKDGAATPMSRSPSPSRTASPRRLFGWGLHRAHSRDEPFIPHDPFQLHWRFFASPSSTPQRPSLELSDVSCEDACTCCLPLPISCRLSSKSKLRTCGSGMRTFLLDTVPRQLYLHVLLRLPAFYFSRVSRIFEDAEVSKHEVQRLIAACAPAQSDNGVTSAAAGIGMSMGAAMAGTPARPNGFRPGNSVFPLPADWDPPSVSPALSRFKHSWEAFVDSLLREWKTLNLVSVLICTALLTLFQVQDATGDPITRWSALFSLICALMSLTYGCTYIVQFGTMRSMYKASRWAEEAQKSKTFIWWNVWVLLSMPAVWLSWSMLSFCFAILSYVWRTGASDDPSDGTYPPLTPGEALAIRTVLTVLFGVGLVFFVMILRTFASYGTREVGWRRSWLNNGQYGEAQRAREHNQQRQEEQRGRHGRRPTPHDQPTNRSEATGLGLSGIPTSGNLASMSAVLLQEAELGRDEKNSKEMYTVEVQKVKERISPKL